MTGADFMSGPAPQPPKQASEEFHACFQTDKTSDQIFTQPDFCKLIQTDSVSFLDHFLKVPVIYNPQTAPRTQIMTFLCWNRLPGDYCISAEELHDFPTIVLLICRCFDVIYTIIVVFIHHLITFLLNLYS